MIGRIAVRAAVLAGLWWLISAGATGAWLIGIPTIAVATYASWRLRGPARNALSVPGVLRYIGFFVSESIKGGVGVARRAIARPVDVQPGLVTYDTMLPEGLPRVLLSSSISLLPGTLTVDLDGNTLTIHTLTKDDDPIGGLVACERRVAEIFVNGRASGNGAVAHVRD